MCVIHRCLVGLVALPLLVGISGLLGRELGQGLTRPTCCIPVPVGIERVHVEVASGRALASSRAVRL
jgi:hypothetical protein